MSQNRLERRNNELELIEFLIEEELGDGSTYLGYYGINVAKVLEIIRMPTVTSMPNARSDAGLGTFNLRGKVLPLVDLGGWLGKKLISKPSDKVLVTEFCGVQAAFVVSAVTSIHRLTWDQIEPVNAYVQNYSHHSVTGVINIGGKVLFILDMEKILASLDPALDMSRVEVQAAPVQDAENFHLLVVDDSLSIRNILRGSLTKAGFRVTDKGNGREAWEHLMKLSAERGEGGRLTDEIQLVISDIEMPEMDGHTLTEHIRGDSFTKDVPVILFSSLITDAVRQKGLKVGADRQVSKPDLPGLSQIVRELIHEKLHL